MVAAVAHIQGVKREVQLLQPKKHVRDLDFTKNSNNLFHYRPMVNMAAHPFVHCISQSLDSTSY